ncbi:MAG TPA: 4-hydroxy-3-methylbut-2-enyl diphosphate reductase, partial [Firmicutes bacterium]|nr:4-hydroxy-3-methylbut-2-enyl diphosphate reductase [Bacillota bacterium]
MEVKVGEHAGFCPGVRQAVEKALAEAAKGRPVFTLGPLVHNEAVVKYLSDRGIEVVEEPEQAVGATLVIRTHGVALETMQKIKSLSIDLLDTTCPRVRRVQEIAARLSKEGIDLIIFGQYNHPEVVGMVGWAGGKAVVVSSLEDLESIDIKHPAALIAQTTGNNAVFNVIKEAFLTRVPTGQVFETLCPEVKLRQEEARQLAKQVEAMIVVGSATSANTALLVEECRRIRPTCRVVDAGELNGELLRRNKVVGVTAGASTPHWTIKEVVEKMENENIEVENEEQFTYQDSVKSFLVGEQAKGRVVQVNSDEVLIDIGYKTEAVLPRSEVHLNEGETLADLFSPSSEIEITVIESDDSEGKIVVSHRRLAKENRWQELEESLKSQSVEEGRVKQVVPAGMVLSLGAGIEGFMPGSLVDVRYVPDFKPFLNEVVRFKVIEINREKDKVILSRKKLLEEEIAQKRAETLSSLQAGTIIEGVVRRLTDFGAFVDVGGIDGLIHISELSWERVGHPQEVLKVGEEVSVKVLDVNPERERISLSLKQALPDPWTDVDQEFKSGMIITGKITRLVNFGAFVELK